MRISIIVAIVLISSAAWAGGIYTVDPWGNVIGPSGYEGTIIDHGNMEIYHDANGGMITHQRMGTIDIYEDMSQPVPTPPTMFNDEGRNNATQYIVIPPALEPAPEPIRSTSSDEAWRAYLRASQEQGRILSEQYRKEVEFWDQGRERRAAGAH